jgi:hypothetical protein
MHPGVATLRILKEVLIRQCVAVALDVSKLSEEVKTSDLTLHRNDENARSDFSKDGERDSAENALGSVSSSPHHSNDEKQNFSHTRFRRITTTLVKIAQTRCGVVFRLSRAIRA